MKKTLLLIALFFLFISITHAQAVKQFPKVKMGTVSTGSPEVTLKLVARIQSFNATTRNPHDVYDKAINSPKSALILEKTVNGQAVKKLYVNNLEGGVTSVYDVNNNFQKITEISHSFSAADSVLFKETNFPGYQFKAHKDRPNVFIGKPVEMCLSNNNKYLWVRYYRRDYDKL